VAAYHVPIPGLQLHLSFFDFAGRVFFWWRNGGHAKRANNF
jgi:hypothetical protein